MFTTQKTKDFKVFYFIGIFLFYAQSLILGQNIRITKPFLGTNQICSNSFNPNYLSYAFSSNVINSSSYVSEHLVEISNDLGLILPRQIMSSIYPNINIIYTGSIYINNQNLPAGTGYRIRVLTQTPSVYSDFSDPFTVLSSPDVPILNVTGNVILCPGVSQALSVTNTNATYNYQWQKNSTNISNATATSYIISTSGSYNVKISSSNGCSNSSNTIYVTQTNLPKSQLAAWNINYSTGNPLYIQSNQSFTLRAVLYDGKPPYNYTLSDGTNTIAETNINSYKDYYFVSPASGVRSYSLSTMIDACGSQINNSSSIKVRINDSKYCAARRSSNIGNSGIKSFLIQGTTINNINSGKHPDSWAEYLTPANINANVNYNFSITSILSTPQAFSIWADLNQNGIFETNEKIFPTGNTTVQVFSGNYNGVIKLPTYTFNGQTRIRVMLDNSSIFNSHEPCGLNSDGEAEDYVLNVYNGATPTTIVADSLPRNGICLQDNFNVNFHTTGPALPINTNYKVLVCPTADFNTQYTTIVGTGTSSPITCASNNIVNSSEGINLFVKVVPTNNIPTVRVENAPNVLTIRPKPTLTMMATIYNGPINPPWIEYRNVYSIAPSTPMTVYAFFTGGSPPFSFLLNDGRTITSAAIYRYELLENNKLYTSDTQYSATNIADRYCSNTSSGGVNISVGSPSLKITKAFKSYSDTAAITKLCGQFMVQFGGEHLDTLNYRGYYVQISDANGSFANPIDIGSMWQSMIKSEVQGGQYVYCEITTAMQIAPGLGYRLRVIKKSGNVISPISTSNYEVATPPATLTTSLAKSVINEGEVTILNANFSGGVAPYYLNLNLANGYGQYFRTNNSSININLSPLHSERYSLYFGSTCAGNFTPPNIYLDVQTLDQNNAQRYIKPFQKPTYATLFRNSYIIGVTDTLFKLPFNNYTPNTIINGYYDYNSYELLKPSSVVHTGETYSLVQLNNRGYSYVDNLLTGIWLDLNQDGDFDDAGEELVKNNFTQPWSISQTQTFTIPSNANAGFTRLRVRVMAKESNTTPFIFDASNAIERVGNTYDIPIVLLSNAVTSIISAPKILGNTLCNGNSFDVDFNAYGLANGSNMGVELSDENGTFSSMPFIIGQSTNSPINVTLPLSIPSGNYSVRVVANGTRSVATSPFNVTANQLLSMVDGDWHAGNTWSCGRVPTLLDHVTITNNTNITVFSGDARVGSLVMSGVLSFLNGTRLKFINE